MRFDSSLPTTLLTFLQPSGRYEIKKYYNMHHVPCVIHSAQKVPLDAMRLNQCALIAVLFVMVHESARIGRTCLFREHLEAVRQRLGENSL